MIINIFFQNQIILGLILASLFFVPWRKRRQFFWGRFLVFTLGIIILSHYSPLPKPYSYLLDAVSIFLMVFSCFKCSVKQAVFSTTNAYCVQHITSKITYIVFNFLRANKFLNVRNMQLFVLLCLLFVNLVVLLFIYFLFTKNFLKNQNLKIDRLHILIASCLFIVVAVFLSHYAESNLLWWNYAWAYFYLSSICILFAILVLLINVMNCKYQRLEEEKIIIEQLLKKDEIQYERAKLNMERIKIRCHDLKHQSSSLTEKERAQLDREIKELQAMYYTGNKALDITLSEKALICANEDIQFTCSIDGECVQRLTPYHIYSLFGNAIDNAIECLKEVKELDKKILRINVGRRGEMALIQIENYTPQVPIFEEEFLKTTKNDSELHGFGLKSIKNIAEEYGGNMYISIEDHIFQLTIMIPLVTTNQ